MGKAIQKKWFGPATTPGLQIVVSGVKFADGTTATNDFIIKQTGSTAYIVQDSGLTHDPEIVFMVNAADVSTLLPGQCFIMATPFGGSPLPCEKISQFRLSLYDTVNTVPREAGNPAVESVSSYSWSTVPATEIGQADLIGGAGGVGGILTVLVDGAGFGYFTAPSVSFTGGFGGSATATVANGAITGFTGIVPGAGYNGGVVLGAPTTSVTAHAVGTRAFGATGELSGYTGLVGGGYYTSAPAGATITAPPASVTALISDTTDDGAGGVTLGALTVTNGGGYYSISGAPVLTFDGATLPVIDLASAITYGVGAASAITAANPSAVTGDIFLSPAGAISGTITGGGTVDNGNAAAATALAAASDAFDAGNLLPGYATIGAELGSTSPAPGYYTTGSSFEITGTLTLNGSATDVWVFKSPSSTLTTAAASVVLLTGGALAKNVYWLVGSSATLGTGSTFSGTIIASASITDNGGSTVDGHMFALTAAVTLDDTTVTTTPAGDGSAGSGITYTTVVTNGVLTSANVTGAGTGYGVGPVTVTVSAPDVSPVTASYSGSTLTNGAVATLTGLTAGAGYYGAAPTVTAAAAPAAAVQATAHATVSV